MHREIRLRVTKPGRLFCSTVLFIMVGQLRRPLIGKRGGNISYLCSQNFKDLLFSGFEPSSFRFVIKKKKLNTK